MSKCTRRAVVVLAEIFAISLLSSLSFALAVKYAVMAAGSACLTELISNVLCAVGLVLMGSGAVYMLATEVYDELKKVSESGGY